MDARTKIGFLDLNGKDICVDDIVVRVIDTGRPGQVTREKPAVVQQHPSGRFFLADDTGYLPIYKADLVVRNGKECYSGEVIGNIKDNPELLRGE